VKYYDIFKAETNGGKRFAVIDESLPESVMPEIAISSNAPITAFIIKPVGAGLASPEPAKAISVRFFTNAGKEKLESDSGALVVAHHFGHSCSVQMQGGVLEVGFEDGVVWAAQPDTHILPLPSDSLPWLEALNLQESDLESGLMLMCAGTLEKHNLIVPIRESALNLEPNFGFLTDLLKAHGLNGCVVVSFLSSRGNLEYRFFAPHKGLLEDNAGSFSLASVCGYLAAHSPSGFYDQVAAQGFQMGKPSELRARFIARDGVALAVRVGGKVESVL
jgi:predicted PhzF superfamily epimerase YddE/YHI9